jgi:hypothetical protein
MTPLLARLLLPLALVNLAQAGVTTVGPTGTFPDIQPAIDAAQPGDVLLVEPGSYSPFVLSKALRIYAAPGATIDLHPGLQAEVTGIPAGAEAVIAGLTLGTCPDSFCVGAFPGACFSMRVRDNEGTVLIQSLESLGISIENSALAIVADCALLGRKDGGCLTALAGPGIALEAIDSEVWIVGSTLDGNGASSPQDLDHHPGLGLRAQDASVYVAESTVLGGSGGTTIGTCAGGGPTFVGLTGLPGIEAAGASLIKVVSGPSGAIAGGDGGSSTSFCGGLGAPGIRLLDTSYLILVDSIPVTGGTDFAGGQVHPPVETQGAAEFDLTSLIYPVLDGPARTTPGGAALLVASGNPGAGLALFLSFQLGGRTLLPGVDGAAALDPAGVLFLGGATLDAAGLATFPLAVPPIPALVGFLGVFQGVESGGPQVAFTNPVAVSIYP